MGAGISLQDSRLRLADERFGNVPVPECAASADPEAQCGG